MMQFDALRWQLRKGCYPSTCRTLIGVLVLAGTVGAVGEVALEVPSTTGAAGSGAQARIENPVFDFGRVAAGEVFRHTFTLVNEGDRTLHLTQVKSSCGCVLSGTWTRDLEPGQTGSIPVEVYTAKMSGVINKPLTVFCNDANRPEFTLSVKGEVWHPIEFSPESLVIHYPTGALRSVSGTMRIINHRAEPLALSEPRSNQRGLEVVLRTNKVGVEYEMEVRTVPPLGAGNVFGKVTLRTSLTNQSELSIPVYALGQAAVNVVPGSIALPAGALTNSAIRTVTVRGPWAEGLVVSEPEFPDPAVLVQVEKPEPEVFIVALTFPAGYRLEPKGGLELRLKTNQPGFESIRVPVMSSVAGRASIAVPAVSPAPARF